MFDRNFVEAMPACFACFALAQRGKRPCARLIETLWKRCWHVLQPTVCKPCLAMSYLRTESDAGMFRFGPTWEEAM